MKTMWWIWILILILFILVLLGKPKIGFDEITTTVSGPPTISQPRKEVKRAARIAEHFWGGTRCLHISYHYRDLPGKKIAVAKWYSSNLSSRSYFQCSITFDTQKISISHVLYCAVVVHEFGHLSGYQGLNNQFHSKNPKNIMYPVMSLRNIPKICRGEVQPVLYRQLKVGLQGYDVAGAKRCVYRLLGRNNSSRWAYYTKLSEKNRRIYSPLFKRHMIVAQSKLGIKQDGIFRQKMLDIIYRRGCDLASDELFALAHPERCQPIPKNILYTIIGYPGQGTHNASDWQSRNALDWRALSGTQVLAPVSGRVTRPGGSNGTRYVGNKIIFGMKLTITANKGPDIFITHLQDLRYLEGEIIPACTVIAEIGNFGPGSHAHVGMEYGNPSQMLSWPRIISSTR
jgi:hypothetical protein